MNRITIDDSLTLQLNSLHAPVEVVDKKGHTLGHFVPTARHAADDCPYSAEELDQMRGESGGRALAEIWKSLGAK